MRKVVVLLLLLPSLAACGKLRPVGGEDPCPTWLDAIGPALNDKCATCHSGEMPEGNYDVTSYRGVLGGGADDIANLVAGQSESTLSDILDPAAANAAHQGFEALRADIVRWSGVCGAPYARRRVHKPGVLVATPESTTFHGALWKDANYELEECARCHDGMAPGEEARFADLVPGELGSGAACTECHVEGGTGCGTCHNGAGSGAHAQHLNVDQLAQSVGCDACHSEPETFEATGHVLLADGTLDPEPSEVVFGTLANASLKPDDRERSGPASYDAASSTCGAVYCHGGTFEDATARAPTPSWAEAGEDDDCVSCHGMPPASHVAGADCTACHEDVVDMDFAIISPSLHIDGQLALRDGIDRCDGCHGSGDKGGPPPSLAGETSSTDPVVGAHEAHDLSPRGLRGPMGCGACHVVPTEVWDAGHLDDDGVAELTFGALASTGSADPSYDSAAGTCASIYCHGTAAEPQWTDSYGAEFNCGSCHGAPPSSARHRQSMTLSSCANCHAESVAGNGAIILRTGSDGEVTSRHLNGVIDAN